jgi:hypothetical protein
MLRQLGQIGMLGCLKKSRVIENIEELNNED